MSNDDSKNALMEQVGSVRKLAEGMVSKFADKATPSDMLQLATLLKEAREMEHRAAVARDTIAANRELAMETMRLREKILDTVVKSRLDRADRQVDALIAKLATTDDPEMIKTLVDALATAATTDTMSDAGTLMEQVRSGKIDLEF